MEKLKQVLINNYINKDNIRKQIAPIYIPKKKKKVSPLLIGFVVVLLLGTIVYFLIKM